MKTKFVINKLVILFFLIALLLNSNNVISSCTTDTTTKTGTYLFNSLVEHDPIQITSESDSDLAEFSGTGAIGDPYIIEGYLIETIDIY
ncbi:MAG: hypothetical protein KAS95_03660, partial [Candidatus Heimdallarchaeota archaeon]|nr:hypothetical protein [Candidatus Heimdallarchaeota archaeon]